MEGLGLHSPYMGVTDRGGGARLISAWREVTHTGG